MREFYVSVVAKKLFKLTVVSKLPTFFHECVRCLESFRARSEPSL